MRHCTHRRSTGYWVMLGLAAVLVAVPAAGAKPGANCRNNAATVSIGVSYSARPYVFPRANRGIQIDITRQALDRAGYEFCPVYLPTLRAVQSFAKRRLDGLMNVQKTRFEGYLSEPIVTYHNCAYSLADREIEVASAGDFANLTTVAFQGARHVLSADFAENIAHMANYYEVADQEMQLLALFRRRADVVVMDQRIFAYYWDQFAMEAQERDKPRLSMEMLRLPVREDCLFQPARYGIEFADAEVRDGFNAALQQMQKAGHYQQIIQRYLPDTAIARE